MRVEYEINESDFLAYQLFAASKSERINKKKNNTWFLLTGIAILFTINFYNKHNTVMTAYCGVVAILCGLFYPTYFIWRYKRHYKSYVNEVYAKRFGQKEILEFTDDYILSINKIGEEKINISEVEQIDETDKYFFVKISNGMHLLIPKDKIDNCDELKQVFQRLGLIIKEDFNQKWK